MWHPAPLLGSDNLGCPVAFGISASLWIGGWDFPIAVGQTVIDQPALSIVVGVFADVADKGEGADQVEDFVLHVLQGEVWRQDVGI